MARYEFNQYINMFVPFTFEEQMEKFSAKEGRHILDFRMKETTSEVAVQGSASYMLQGVPFVRVSNDGTFERFEDVFPSKYPKLLINSGNQKAGDILMHPSGDNRNYYSAGFDFLLNHQIGNYPSAGDKGTSDTFLLKITAVSGHYVIVEDNLITGWSEALKYDLEAYFIKHGFKGSFEENLNNLRIEDVFGSERDEAGVAGVFYNPNITNLNFRLVPKSHSRSVVSGIKTRPITSLTKGTRIDFATSRERFSGIVALYTHDGAATLGQTGSYALPLFDLKSPQVLHYTTEGGGTTTTTSTAGGYPPGVSLNGSGFFNQKRIWGNGPAGESLIISFPSTNVERLVEVQSNGTWELNVPAEVNYTTFQQVSNIQIRTAEVAASSISTETVTTIEPTVVKQLGLPLLKTENTAITFTDTVPTYFSRKGHSDPRVSGISYIYNHSYKNLEDIRYQMGALQIIPSKEGAPFISSGLGVIKDLGVTVFVSIVLDKAVSGTIEESEVSTKKIFDVVLGKSPKTLQMLYPFYSLRWNSIRPVVHKAQLSFKYRKSYEPNKLEYAFRYKLNAVKTVKNLRYRFRWDSSKNRVRSFQYSTRFTTGLPEVITKRSFYVFEWTKASQITHSLRYSTKWRSTLFRRKNLEYKLAWKTEPVDPVIVKPYFVKSYDPKTKIWTDKISFQVYGDSDYVSTHIANDDLWFYFSNPDKFEIVKFNYNLLPYSGIFLEELSDSTLDDREGVPETYKKIGNYTVKGINNINSVSLDVVGGGKQLNEARSYWIPIDINDWGLDNFDRFSDGTQNYVHKLDLRFRDDHHEDVVELDLIILNDEECCFTQKSSGSRCSPY